MITSTQTKGISCISLKPCTFSRRSVMGESLSKFGPPLDRQIKRFKSDDNIGGQDKNNGSVTANATQTQSRSSQTTVKVRNVLLGWHQLPHVVIVEIYQYLSNNDKLSASLTCHGWLEPFSRPVHWTRGNFLFNRVDEWRALHFSRKMGSSVRHITADCSGPRRTTKTSTRNLTTFLNSLLQRKNFRLLTLKVTNMRRMLPLHIETDCNYPQVLIKLLEGQTQLKILDFSNAGLTDDQGLRLLLAMSTCGQTIESLAYPDLMPEFRFDIDTDERHVLALSRFVNLRELSVSHHYLSDNVLLTLASAAPEKLRILRIRAFCYIVFDSQTSENAWELLTKTCPDLEVTYVIKGISHHMFLSLILTPSIPLYELHWHSANHTNVLNTKNCFYHIKSLFQITLRHLVLELYPAFLDDEEDIAGLIEKCTRLETLSIDSPIAVTQQIRVERAIRRAVMKLPNHCLKTVTVNKEVISLDENWFTSLMGWLIVHVN